ncbi:AAA family ATPase [Corallococcus sp. M7]
MRPSTQTLRDLLKKHFVASDEEWIADIHILPGNAVNGTIVSQLFESVAVVERLQRVNDFLQQLQLHAGFLTLCSPNEARELELDPSNEDSVEASALPATWSDLAEALAGSEEREEIPSEASRPRIITFYSYKGGVGRTTAITHVAHELARRGRKVVLIDLDLEAPGIHTAFDIPEPARMGLVEYLYRMANSAVPPNIPISEVFGEVKFRSEARGRLFVVPAGHVDAGYISRVASLAIEDIIGKGGPWEQFVDALRQQLDPDYLLIDSRTGINAWAAFSMFQAADEIFIVFHPNTQNIDGLRELLRGMHLLGLGSRIRLISSMIPATEEGKRKAGKAIAELEALYRLPVKDTELTESEGEERTVRVLYNAHAALAERVPFVGLEQSYLPAANLIDETSNENNVVRLLDRLNRREVVESMPFQEVRAEQLVDNNRLGEVFHRTADFDRLLDGPTCLVRGRKGTGKSVIYWLFTKRKEVVEELAGTRLRGKSYLFLSGHGKADIKPGIEEFREFDKLVSADQWDVVWRAIILLRFFLRVPALIKPAVRRALNIDDKVLDVIKVLDPDASVWGREHTQAVEKLAQLPLQAKYALDAVNEHLSLSKPGQEAWLFFDDLDEDLRTEPAFRNRVLSGLFGLIQTGDARKHASIRFKVLLREDLWSDLTFQNKSHFDGRHIVLQWRREDMLRLALRQARGSRQFDDIVRRFRPIVDLDAADEATLYQALEPLWGIRVGKVRSKFVYRWVYERLSDSQGNFFPRSMQHLLMGAKEAELDYLRQSNIQPKTDRLLRFDALVNGLQKRASDARVSELKEEYPDMKQFLGSLKDDKSPLSSKKLEELWVRAGKPHGQSFDEAVEWMKSIGFLRGEDQDGSFKVVDLYLWGLNMFRDGGP